MDCVGVREGEPPTSLKPCSGMEDFKTGMDSVCAHSTKNTESCYAYAEADGSRWNQAGTSEAGKVHFLNWF